MQAALPVKGAPDSRLAPVAGLAIALAIALVLFSSFFSNRSRSASTPFELMPRG